MVTTSAWVCPVCGVRRWFVEAGEMHAWVEAHAAAHEPGGWDARPEDDSGAER